MKGHPIRPQRSSLVAETVRVLRQGIQSGLWRGHLPGERVLCSQWQISRPTLRAAMEVLQREKLVEVAHGCRTKVLTKPPAKSPVTLTVGLLSPEPLHAMPPFVMLWVDELRGQLANEGHLLQVVVGRAGFGRKNPARALESLIAGTPAAAWVLYQATEAMQRWFSEHDTPCVVVGSSFPGTDLSAVDRDYRAACRHAVGLFAGRQHKRVALLIRREQLGGDIESERGFLEGLESFAQRGVSGTICRHDGTNAGLCAKLDDLLAEKPRPTALLVARSAAVLTVLTHLLRRGVRIPQDMALVCRDDDTFLDSTEPRVARYAVSPAAFAKRVHRMVVGLVQDGLVREGNVRVMPTFTRRESV